jgi:predicted ABC-type ATPase
MASRKRRPRCIVIAGPNGAGKTTFAKEYLPRVAKVIHFVNADLIAAARVVLREIDRLATERTDFAFETTLSGLTYLRRINSWKHSGYGIEIVYLRLDSVDLAIRRIAARVLQGGHDVLRRDVIRRFTRGWVNFKTSYRPMADSWAIYDNSGAHPVLLDKQS